MVVSGSPFKMWAACFTIEDGVDFGVRYANGVNGQGIPGSTTNLREGELDTPDLTLVAQTILANELQLRVPMV